MKAFSLQHTVFCLLMAAFLAFAGCGSDEVLPNAAITFFPAGDEATASPGEEITLRVRLSPADKISALTIEKSISGVKEAFPAPAALPDSATVFLFSDQINPATPRDTKIVYTFRATTTDGKVTVRTYTITVAEMAQYDQIKLGAQDDTVTGNFYASRNNQVFVQRDSAKNKSSEIDFVFFNKSGTADSLAKYEATLAAPANSQAILVYPSIDTLDVVGIPSWGTRNETKFKPAPESTYDLNGVFGLNRAYKGIAKEETRVSKLDTGANSVFLFITSENKIGVAKIREIITTPSAAAGSIVFDIKVQR